MVVRFTLKIIIFCLAAEFFSLYLLYSDLFIKEVLNVKDTIILLFGSLIFFPVMLMVATTGKYTFTDKSIISQWKISLGFKTFYKCRREAPYNQLYISDWTPYFTRLYILYVSGPNNFGAFFGLFHTKKKEVFLILAEYAKNAKMDEGARKILEKYKKKYKDKINVKKLVKR